MTSSDPAVKVFLESAGLTVRLIRLGRRMSQDQVASVSCVTLDSIEQAGHAATLVTYVRI